MEPVWLNVNRWWECWRGHSVSEHRRETGKHIWIFSSVMQLEETETVMATNQHHFKRRRSLKAKWQRERERERERRQKDGEILRAHLPTSYRPVSCVRGVKDGKQNWNGAEETREAVKSRLSMTLKAGIVFCSHFGQKDLDATSDAVWEKWMKDVRCNAAGNAHIYHPHRHKVNKNKLFLKIYLPSSKYKEVNVVQMFNRKCNKHEH